MKKIIQNINYIYIYLEWAIFEQYIYFNNKDWKVTYYQNISIFILFNCSLTH